MRVETFSSGSLTLDLALGGGYPRGRVIEIYGPESSGKTTLALHAVAEIQKKGGSAAFIDAEHALDPVYARSLGVNIDDLLVSQPDSGEMALDVVDQLVRSSGVDVVVIDSVAALVPKVSTHRIIRAMVAISLTNTCAGGTRGGHARPADGSTGAPHVQSAAQDHRLTV